MYFDHIDNDCKIDDDDQCFNCRYFEEENDDVTRCPLFNAITQGMVILPEPITIEGCKLHVPSIH